MSRARFISGAAILLIVVGTGLPVMAQSPATSVAMAAMPATGGDAEAAPKTLRLLVGRSTIVNPGAPITRVSLTSSDIADAMLTGPAQLLVHGKLPGTISMFVWERTGAIQRYEITVQRDLAQLNGQLKELFPSEAISVDGNGRTIVLTGRVSSKDVSERAANLASSFVEKKDDVINLLQLPEARSNQVLLRVRFAEVSRSALTELAVSAAANGYNNGRWIGRSTTQQFAAPSWDADGKFVFSDFLNLFLFDTKNQLAGVIKALQTKGLFQSLAEPNLVAESGKEASFLAGGEFPVPVPQGGGGTVVVTIAYKEFGIRLHFTPIVNGNRVHLKVAPEVSTLDFGNAVQLNGFRIPALSTRKTETELELQDHQTFAIAGLLSNQMTKTMQKIPGIGDIPILGMFFRSRSAQKDQSELVVMITPEILPLDSPGVTPDLPNLQEPFLPPAMNTVPQPPPAFQSRSGAAAQAAEPRSPSTPTAAAAPAPSAVTSPAPAQAAVTSSAPAPADVTATPPPTAVTSSAPPPADATSSPSAVPADDSVSFPETAPAAAEPQAPAPPAAVDAGPDGANDSDAAGAPAGDQAAVTHEQ